MKKEAAAGVTAVAPAAAEGVAVVALAPAAGVAAVAPAAVAEQKKQEIEKKKVVRDCVSLVLHSIKMFKTSLHERLTCIKTRKQENVNYNKVT